MSKTPSGIKQIALKAGVHVSTVSRALNPQTRTMVSQESGDAHPPDSQ